MDFFIIKEAAKKKDTIEIFPDFIVRRSNDLMVRAKGFHAIWDAERGLWSQDEYDVQRLVDNALLKRKQELEDEFDSKVTVRFMSDFASNAWVQFRRYLSSVSDNSKELDKKITYANTKVNKTDYVSRRLPYNLEEGPIDAYDYLMDTLYDPEEREKLEWAIGAVLTGDSKNIQKFIVLYGEGGSGKSTFLNLLQKLFEGYYTTFEAKSLTSSRNDFSTEVFRHNPLVAIQHDGDLSRIEDNTKLNSIVSHEEMTMNEKYKPSYSARINAFLFMATNKPVRITDAKSGIIRRLIDVKPSGRLLDPKDYFSTISRMDFELGAIAHHCIKVYRELGKNYYSTYKPLGMISRTDVFFNFVENYFYTFIQQDGVSLSQAYSMYKEFCEDSLIEYKLPRYKFRDELKNYFKEFHEVTRIDGRQVRSYYSGFLRDKFEAQGLEIEIDKSPWLVMDEKTSYFDGIAKNYKAQLAKEDGTPSTVWSKVKTKLEDIDTQKLHYVQVPINHIVIDFDIRDENENKSAALNIEAASKFPPTYAEYSKSRAGIHLHYIYTGGDPEELSRLYDTGIEIKVFPGNASLRRQFSSANNYPISEIDSGLPLKEKRMIDSNVIQNEKKLRALILKNLKKEIHPATKPSIDFIYQLLEDAAASNISYDLRDLYPAVMNFAAHSTNQAQYCMKLVMKMKFNSEEPSEPTDEYSDSRLVFFDVEVFPNLFIVNWKYEGKDSPLNHMINPTPQDIENLLSMKLVGFNNRRYDNHILYARYLGYDNAMLFETSSKIVNGYKTAMFREAYGLSYADIYDFTSKKQSLKKYQIELGISHKELGFPFDQPVPKDMIPQVLDYCDNDVISTEHVFNARKEDFVARQILADLSGLRVNDTTQNHTARIIFGQDRRPQDKFVYTDLSELFPGYKFDRGVSYYKNEEPGEGGYVYSEPGFYRNVALLDVASMHPTSIKLLNLFGEYTEKYTNIMDARLAIKRGDIDKARDILGDVLDKYLVSVDDTNALSYALKIVINIVYGLTSAKFNNPFLDVRNKDNIVAKRGALFMVDLKHAIKERGWPIIHIKTDSVKIPDATPEMIKFVTEFGKKYGYTFEHEATYDRFLLVNDAVYVARKPDGKWSSTGAEFSHPYIFKTLFSKEPIEFADLAETKTVTTALYIHHEGDEEPSFVGKAGSFIPVKENTGGGPLLREKDGSFHSATGAKGWFWRETEQVKLLNLEDTIDMDYYRTLVDKAVDHINEFVDFDTLTK